MVSPGSSPVDEFFVINNIWCTKQSNLFAHILSMENCCSTIFTNICICFAKTLLTYHLIWPDLVYLLPAQ